MIPHYPKSTISVATMEVDESRHKINSQRRRHFVGKNDNLTLRGKDAVAFHSALGFNPLCAD